MSLYVNKETPALVRPSRPTPSGTLPLSVVDRLPFLRCVTEVIMVFDHGKEPAQVIREAISKALVPYYLVAGRIAADSDGEIGVTCTGEGVLFVEASADCRLEDVDFLSGVPVDFSKEQLLPSPQEVDELALPCMMQVTQFKCGGFVVGIKFNHAFFDRMGVGQFIVAVGDMARGLDEPKIKPVWCRDILRHPVPPKPADDIGPQRIEIQDPAIKLRQCAIDIPLDCIDRQKDRFADATGQKCTTFDVVTAKLWQSRTRAINLPRDADVSFLFIASVRHLHEELPPGGGYYGNCIEAGVTKASCQQIASATLFDVVRLIKEAKQYLPTKYSRSLTGQDPPPMMQEPGYGNLAVFDWRRLGFYDADFGWGGASHVVRLNEQDGIAGAARIFLSPLPKTGIRVMTHCVVEEHYEAFLKEMNSWS